MVDSINWVAERLIDAKNPNVSGLEHISQGRTEALLLLQCREGETRKQFFDRAAASCAALHSKVLLELDRLRADASAGG